MKPYYFIYTLVTNILFSLFFPTAVPRATLLPSAPVLTRYAESVNPFAKRKLIVPTVPEEKVANKLNNLTVPKLCAKLNTLQVSLLT
jgi:hypothetical protein